MSSPTESTPVRVGNRYRLDERIGAGAMGAVWRATDELLNRTVAVKELLAAAVAPGAAGSDALEESRQRILREGRIGARLQHPHVISMFDVVVHDDRPWLVMEYLPSKALSTVLAEKGPMEPREAAEVGRQVADGLAAAHLAGVVHRDVKPGNVLMGEDGRVKLTDFGVSRAVDDVQLTRTGMIAGTPAFLSPEVARGREPTAASDVFALGATLYATVEGHPPFGLDENAYALLHKVATGVVEPPRQAGPLTGLIMRLLSTEPTDRPSATQARDALAAVAAGRVDGSEAATAEFGVEARSDPGPPTRSDLAGPVPARPVPARPAPAGPATPPDARRRRRLPLLLAALALLVLGGGIVAALLTSGSGEEQGGQVAAPPATTTVAPEPTTRETEPSATPSTSPSPIPIPTPTPPSSAAPAPAATDPVAFVQGYYGLLPGNTEAAFAQLSPQAQAASGGRQGFDGFYGGMRSVTLQNARQTGENTVEGVVVFERVDGGTSTEPYRFVVAPGEAGATIMESFSRA